MQINPSALIEEKEEVIDLTSQYAATGLMSCLKYGKIIQVVIEKTLSSAIHGDMIIPKLPKAKAGTCFMTLGMANGQCLSCALSNSTDYAVLSAYFPGSVTPSRIDATFTYIAL